MVARLSKASGSARRRTGSRQMLHRQRLRSRACRTHPYRIHPYTQRAHEHAQGTPPSENVRKLTQQKRASTADLISGRPTPRRAGQNQTQSALLVQREAAWLEP